MLRRLTPSADRDMLARQSGLFDPVVLTRLIALDPTPNHSIVGVDRRDRARLKLQEFAQCLKSLRCLKSLQHCGSRSIIVRMVSIAEFNSNSKPTYHPALPGRGSLADNRQTSSREI